MVMMMIMVWLYDNEDGDMYLSCKIKKEDSFRTIYVFLFGVKDLDSELEVRAKGLVG